MVQTSVSVSGRESPAKHNVMKKGENDGPRTTIVETYDGRSAVMDGYRTKAVDAEHHMHDRGRIQATSVG